MENKTQNKTQKILTTHVGSLPREQSVVDFIFAKEHGKAFDQDAFDAEMTRAVGKTVAAANQRGD